MITSNQSPIALEPHSILILESGAEGSSLISTWPLFYTDSYVWVVGHTTDRCIRRT